MVKVEYYGDTIMDIKIQEIKADRLSEYAKIPISFEVKSIFQVDLINNGLDGIRLHEEKVVVPYVKNYDSYDDGGPERWATQFNIHNWVIFLATDNNKPIGGATVAFDTPGVNMLCGRKDLAVLWDIRIHPDFRHKGVGTMLFQSAVEWSKKKGCKQFKVETQNVNAPACKFYAKQECKLGAIDRYGYAGHPKVGHEVMLLWYLDL
jgi:GNAT superfamily N-acetyltransferase